MKDDFASFFDGSRWLIRPRALRALLKQAEHATPADIQAAKQALASRPMAPQMMGDVAVINACGPIMYRASFWSMYFGGCSIEDMQTQLRMAYSDPAVKLIAFRFDSPGGVIDMVQEFADDIYSLRGGKPIIAIADTMICSAAYWLASQMDTIYASASSQLGSIGVFVEHDDISGMLEKAGIKISLIAHGAHKTDGNEYEPLKDDARAELQQQVDEIGGWFDTAVARGRGVTTQVVLETFGQGKVFRGKDAIARGLADKAGTFMQAIMPKSGKGRVSATAPTWRLTPTAIAKADGEDDVTDDSQGPDVVAPDDDGNCADGYTMGDDGMCHLTAAKADPADGDMDEEAAAAARDAEALFVAGSK